MGQIRSLGNAEAHLITLSYANSCLQDISVDHIQGHTPAVNTSVDEEEDDKENSSENTQQEGGSKKKRKQEKKYATETEYYDERKNIVHCFEPHVKPIY